MMQSVTTSLSTLHPPAFFDSKNQLRDWNSAEPLTYEWHGIAKHEALNARFWYIGENYGERSFNVLDAKTYPEARIEAARIVALNVDVTTVSDRFDHFTGYTGDSLEHTLRHWHLNTVFDVTGAVPRLFGERAQQRLCVIFGAKIGKRERRQAHAEREQLALAFAEEAARLTGTKA